MPLHCACRPLLDDALVAKLAFVWWLREHLVPCNFGRGPCRPHGSEADRGSSTSSHSFSSWDIITTLSVLCQWLIFYGIICHPCPVI